MADSILPQQAPYPHAVLGWDGTDFRVFKVDADGQLQIDVSSTALPTGAATSANQATMITALQLIDDLRNTLTTVAADSLRANVVASILPAGAATSASQTTMITALQLIDDLRNALTTVAADSLRANVVASILPSGAATSASQTTMITALQLIDDLRNALDSVGTDELDVNVEDSVLPTGAATSANQTTMITALQLIDDLRNALDSVGTDELDVNVEDSVLPTGAATSANQALILAKMPGLLFNYDSAIHSVVSELNATVTYDQLVGSVPGADEILVITSMVAVDPTSAISSIGVGLESGGTVISVAQQLISAANETCAFSGVMICDAGWRPWAGFWGTVAGDDLYFHITGYVMALA